LFLAGQFSSTLAASGAVMGTVSPLTARQNHITAGAVGLLPEYLRPPEYCGCFKPMVRSTIVPDNLELHSGWSLPMSMAALIHRERAQQI
jgi:hypothetical protein